MAGLDGIDFELTRTRRRDLTAFAHPDLEWRMTAALATLAITRVIVAHRPQTVAAAGRVLRLEDGRLSDVAVTPAAGGARLRTAPTAPVPR